MSGILYLLFKNYKLNSFLYRLNVAVVKRCLS